MYRLENTYTWYLEANEEEAETLHGCNYYDPETEITFKLRKRGQSEQNVLIQWIPLRLKIEAVRVIKSQLGPRETIQRRESRRYYLLARGKPNYANTVGLPHYIEVTTRNREGNEKFGSWRETKRMFVL